MTEKLSKEEYSRWIERGYQLMQRSFNKRTSLEIHILEDDFINIPFIDPLSGERKDRVIKLKSEGKVETNLAVEQGLIGFIYWKRKREGIYFFNRRWQRLSMEGDKVYEKMTEEIKVNVSLVELIQLISLNNNEAIPPDFIIERK